MIGFLDVLTDPAEWAKRWGLRPLPALCQQCRRQTEMTIPFIWGEFRGLRSPKCECGHEGAPYCFVRDYRIGDLFDPPTPKKPKGRKRLAKVIAFRRPDALG